MFHSCKDGMGDRHISVNGNQIKRVLWANVARGLVCYAPYPLQVNKRKGEVYTRLLHGNVEVLNVKTLDGTSNCIHENN